MRPPRPGPSRRPRAGPPRSPFSSSGSPARPGTLGRGAIGIMTSSSTTGPGAGPLSGLTRADVAMIVTRGQARRDALHRDLAQLGLEWLDADSLMEDYSVGGMDLDLYWRAQRVIREHRDMREAPRLGCGGAPGLRADRAIAGHAHRGERRPHSRGTLAQHWVVGGR